MGKSSSATGTGTGASARPEYTRSTLPSPQAFQDKEALVVEADGTRTVLFSDGLAWTSLGGAAVSQSQIAAITATAVAAAPVTAVAGKTGAVALTTGDIGGFSAAVSSAAVAASPIQSVAGKTGAVTLAASDIGGFAVAAAAAAPVPSVAGKTGAITLASTDLTDFATRIPLTAAQLAAAGPNLAAYTGASTGYIGKIDAGNFGVNSVRAPLNFGGVGTTPAIRTGMTGRLARATRPGNIVRLFFGFDQNDTASGLFVAGTDATFSPTSGTGTGYLTTAAMAVGATAIPLGTGTGTVVVRDIVTLAGDPNSYQVETGITAPGTINIVAPGLLKAAASGAALSIKKQTRLDDLLFAIRAIHAAGCKVLLVPDTPLQYAARSDATMTRWRERWFWLLTTMHQDNSYEDDIIDIVEMGNEVYYHTGSGENVAAQAEVTRLAATQIRTFSPRTIILTGSYQGGEAQGSNLPMRLLGASAASSIDVQGDGGGAGTTGEMFIDGIAFHSYTTCTMAQARAMLTSDSAIAATMRAYLEPIRTGIATRRAANPTFWAGRADPPIWNTEYNVDAHGGAQTVNTGFRMQALTKPERQRLLYRIAMGSFAAGCQVVIPYAVDHSFSQGWSSLSGSKTTGANGWIRFLSTPFPVLDGDLVQLRGGWVDGSQGLGQNWTTYATNAAADGSAFDAKGIPAAAMITQILVQREGLGGWHDGWLAVQDALYGANVETGWFSTGNGADPVAPQVRINRGQLLRAVNGTMTAVS